MRNTAFPRRFAASFFALDCAIHSTSLWDAEPSSGGDRIFPSPPSAGQDPAPPCVYRSNNTVTWPGRREENPGNAGIFVFASRARY
jgi:hypothetical protein